MREVWRRERVSESSVSGNLKETSTQEHPFLSDSITDRCNLTERNLTRTLMQSRRERHYSLDRPNVIESTCVNKQADREESRRLCVRRQ